MLEAAATEIANDRDKLGRTMMEIDPEFWAKAKELVDLGAQIAFEERHSGAHPIVLTLLKPWM
jgi:hypothetical protein